MLSKILGTIESGEVFDHPTDEAILSLGVSKLPVIARDNTDRNRTSPFAFTGDKFEFRAIGASASIAVPISFLNAAVADAFWQLSDRLEKKLSETKVRDEAVLSLIREVISEVKPVFFEGNNYSQEWTEEARKRGLSNHTNTPAALAVLENPKSWEFLVRLKVLSAEEIKSRHNIMLERYVKQIEMEAATMLELIETHIFPAVEGEIGRISSVTGQIERRETAAIRLDEAIDLYDRLEQGFKALVGHLADASRIESDSERAQTLSKSVVPAMQELRKVSDELEGRVADELWMLPKYREMFFFR
jgi:glutamine synthetase